MHTPKTGIDQLQASLDGLGSREYRYKKRVYKFGPRVLPWAQELEKAKPGQGFIFDGKVVGRSLGAMLAGYDVKKRSK